MRSAPLGPSADLMDQILAERRPGQFRKAMKACWAKGPVGPLVEIALDRLVSEGWLQSHERSRVHLVVETTLASSQRLQWPLYLALNLDRAGIPLEERGVFRDDPALRAAMDVAAARAP